MVQFTPSRRTLLAAVAGTGSLAGCVDRLSGAPEIRLGRVTISNADRASHRFTLRVRDDGDLVHRSTHEVPGRTDDRIPGATAPCEWGGDPGDYEVGVRVDGGPWTTAALRDEGSLFDAPDCLVAVSRYHPDDGIFVRLAADCDRYDGRFVAGPCAYVRTEERSAVARPSLGGRDERASVRR